MLYMLLDDMLKSSMITKIGTAPMAAEQMLQLLSPVCLPNCDVPHGLLRYCHELWADTTDVAKYIGGKSSGSKLYPPGGYLQWHTNSNNIGIRVYFSYAEKPGCFFRYMRGNEAVTCDDKPGWNVRVFEITKERPLWHCVWAPAARYSFGFNCKSVLPELQKHMIER